MSCIGFLKKVVAGAVTGVAVVTALPIMGTVGTITATGLVVSSVAGAALGAVDAVNGDYE